MEDKPTSPFESVLASCPACGKGFLEQRLNPGSYRVTSSDTDFYPAQRVWLHSDLSHISPLAYFMQTCPSCFFTGEANETIFQMGPPASENYQQKLQIERHLNQIEKPGSFLDKLATAYKTCPQAYSRVVIKFLLGIYDEKLKDQYSNYNLARYYLRLAWVFRESHLSDPNENQTEKGMLKGNLEKLSQQHKKYLGQAEKLRGLLEQEFLTVDPGPPDYSDSGSGYQEILKSLEEQVLPAGQKTDDLLAFLNDKVGFADEIDSLTSLGDFNLASFLLDSKSVWPGVPLNETVALKFSLSYYNQYFDSLPEGANLGPQVQTAYLIGELFRRVGEYPQSRKFFSLAISLGETCLQKEKETYRSAFARKIIDLANRQQSLIEKKQQDLRP